MRRPRPLVVLAASAAAAGMLGGCASGGGSSPPTWQPSPGFSGEGDGVQVSPIVPVPSAGDNGSGGLSGGPTGPGGAGGGGGSGSGKTADPFVVAKHLTSPTGIAMLPDNTALVGERTTGRIVRVQPRPNQPVPTVKTLHGLDASGGGGLLDLALSPDYGQDDLIYAYLTTRTDNRVVEFTLTGPVTPVLTGIPKGRADNTGRIMFDSSGRLYVGTSDAGRPALASNPKSLAGKVLRVTDIGKPAPGNPHRGSAVFTSGHHVVDGLCTGSDGTVVEVESGDSGALTGNSGTQDNINVISAGDYYGWPRAAGTIHTPVATMPAADRAPGGCAVDQGTLYVTSRDGKTLLSAKMTGTGVRLHLASFGKLLANKYGRLLTVVAASDGALWLTTTNRDGHGKPVADDERVIRYIVPTNGGGGNPA